MATRQIEGINREDITGFEIVDISEGNRATVMASKKVVVPRNAGIIEAPTVIIDHNIGLEPCNGGKVLASVIKYGELELTPQMLDHIELYEHVEKSINGQRFEIYRSSLGWSLEVEGVTNKITLSEGKLLMEYVTGHPLPSSKQQGQDDDRIIQYGEGSIGKIVRHGSANIRTWRR